MNARTVHFLLWTTAGLLGAGTVLVLAIGASSPIELPTPALAAASTTQPHGIDSLDRYAVIWSRALREPNPTTREALAAAPTTSPHEVSLTLVGTIGRSLALLQNAAGEIQVKAVGESLDGAEIISVAPAIVEIRYNGKLLTLTKRPTDG